MKKLLSLLVILVIVAWVGFKGAAWWLTEQTLADLRKSWSSAGALTWGRTGSGVTGDVTVNELQFESFRLTSPLAMERAQFSAPDAMALMLALGRNELPEQWSLRFDRTVMNLDAALFRNWVTAGGEAPVPLFAPVCGPDARQHLGSGDFMRMGIDRIAGDALLKQTVDGLNLEIHTWTTGGLDLFWPTAKLQLTETGPQLVSISGEVRVTLRDAGLMRRITAYCARETGQPPDQWADTVMMSFAEGLNARGYQPAPQTLALYRQWLTEGGELVMSLYPDREAFGVPVRAAPAESEPDASAEGLFLNVTYNGAEVPDVYLQAAVQDEEELPEPAIEPVVPSAVESGVADSRWQLATLDDAERWLGYRVRVTLNNARVVEGRLSGIDDERIEVARNVGGGEVAYPMVLRAIDRFEVWRQGQR